MSSEIDENKQQENPSGNIEEAPKEHQKATEKEIMEMCKFIGTFKRWPELCDDIKKIIVEKLDYKERFNLSISSSSDYRVVTRIPQFVHSVNLTCDEDDENPTEVYLLVRFNPNYNAENGFEKIFVESAENTHIYCRDSVHSGDDNRKLTPPDQIWKNCSPKNAAAKHAEELMEKGKFKLEKLEVGMKDYPFHDCIIKKLPLCKKVSFACSREEDFNWWIDKVADELDELDLEILSDDEVIVELSTKFFSNPSVQNSKWMSFTDCLSEISDEQLLELKARTVELEPVNITDHGINAFLKKWARGRGDNVFKIHFHDYTVKNEEDIIRGLRTRVWDERFKEETGDFCDRFRASYDFDPDRGIFQVISERDPYISLTLCFSEELLRIHWTGRKTVLNGETITAYTVV